MPKKAWPQDLIKDLWGYETTNTDEIESFISSYDVLLEKLKNIPSKNCRRYDIIFDEYYRQFLSYDKISQRHGVCKQSIHLYINASIKKLKYFIKSNDGIIFTLQIFPNEPASLKIAENRYVRRHNFNHNHINLFLRNGIPIEKICDLNPNMIVTIPRLGKSTCVATLKYLGMDYLKKYWPECDKTIDELSIDEIYSMFINWKNAP